MANHSETNVWGSVYQWETTDPLLAGAGGIMNNPIAALVGRTGYLKDILEKTLFNGGFAPVTGATTIDSSYQGKAILVTGNLDFNIQLPDAATMVGKSLFFFHDYADNYVYNIVPYGSQPIGVFNIARPVVQLKPQSWFWLMAGSGSWYLIGKSPLEGVGKVDMFTMEYVPLGYLLCNGQAVSRTKYSDLFSYIGTTYGVGNGSTTFNLPDLRGQFIRGLDNGASVDPGRTIGSAQMDSFKTHQHIVPRDNRTPAALDTTGAGSESGGTPDNTGTSSGGYDFKTLVSSDGGGTETRPKNVALQFCIKY